MMVDDAKDRFPFAAEPAATDPDRRDALTRQLSTRFEMNEEDAREIADTILEQFGDAEELNDETLEPSVRSIFYTLESKKLVSFRREEYRWENGELRRGFWWRLRPEELDDARTLVPEARDEDVYDQLPRDAWARQDA